MIRTAVLLAASLVFITSVQAAENPKEVALERMLHGEWKGPACGGDWVYAEDGTFTAQHYSPGGNQLSGTWEVRWKALPPTLVRTCKTSDDPDLVGKTWEVKLVQMDNQALAYQYPDQYPSGHTVRYRRLSASDLAKRELEALQGAWVPLQYEEGGKNVRCEITRHVIKGDKVTVEVNGETIAEGNVVLDPTKNPKQLDLRFTSGQTDLIIYVRVGDYVVYCGNRDGKTRPAEFASGTAKGGEYLMVWKIQK